MQLIAFIGLALVLYELYRRVQNARNQPPSNPKRRFKIVHILLAALVAWLAISIQLQHLDGEMSGESQKPETTWERVVQRVSEWL